MSARRSTPRRPQPTTQQFQPVIEDVLYNPEDDVPRNNYRRRNADGIRATVPTTSMGIVPIHITLPEHLHHASALWSNHVRDLLYQHIDVLRYQGPDGIIAYGYVTTPEDFVKLLHNYGRIDLDRTPYVDRNWDMDTKADHYIEYWTNWYRLQEDLAFVRRPRTQQQAEEENYFDQRLAQLDRNHDTRLRLQGLLQDGPNELEQELLAVLENLQMLPTQRMALLQEYARLREYEDERNEFLILAAQQPEPIEDYFHLAARMRHENETLNYFDDQIRGQHMLLRRLIAETTEPRVRLSPGSPLRPVSPLRPPTPPMQFPNSPAAPAAPALSLIHI